MQTVQAKTTSIATTTAVIQAYVDWNGDLKIVSTPTDRRREQQPLNWNKIGLAGPQGEKVISGGGIIFNDSG